MGAVIVPGSCSHTAGRSFQAQQAWRCLPTNFDIIIRRQKFCTCDVAVEAKSLGEMCQTVVTRRWLVHERDRQERHLF